MSTNQLLMIVAVSVFAAAMPSKSNAAQYLITPYLWAQAAVAALAFIAKVLDR